MRRAAFFYFAPPARKRGACRMAKYVPIQPSCNVGQFCVSEGMSRPYYGKLRAAGLGPKEMRFGNKVSISHQERLAWQQRMANPDDATAKAIQQIKDRMAARGRKAAAASVASAKHISVTRRRTKQR
jgi:hypothetical protein